MSVHFQLNRWTITVRPGEHVSTWKPITLPAEQLYCMVFAWFNLQFRFHYSFFIAPQHSNADARYWRRNSVCPSVCPSVCHHVAVLHRNGLTHRHSYLQDIAIVTTYGTLMGTRTRSIECFHFQWLWVTFNLDFKVTEWLYRCTRRIVCAADARCLR